MGYIRLKVNRKCYLAHRLAWFWVTGEWPEQEIDHRDGIKDANCWLNIRESTKSQNQHNRGIQSNNTSGYKGVCWDKVRQKWQSYIRLNYKRNHLGYFDTPEEAHAFRCDAAKRLHGEFHK